MSCVMSVVGICPSDDGLKSVRPGADRNRTNAKHLGHEGSCLIIKS